LGNNEGKRNKYRSIINTSKSGIAGRGVFAFGCRVVLCGSRVACKEMREDYWTLCMVKLEK